MDIKGFQVWLSAARGLTRAQRREALAVLSGRSEGEASKAAIELGVDEARRCPHCAREGAVSRGMARGLRRYQCKGCGRTFNALSGTPLSGLHHKGRSDQVACAIICAGVADWMIEPWHSQALRNWSTT